MPSPKAILGQLQFCLSQMSTRFNSTIAVDGAVSASNILTLDIPDHGLSAGQELFIHNALVKNKIVDVQLSGNALLFTTQDEHDLTAYMVERAGRNWPLGANVTIEGLGDYDLDPNAAGVQSRTTFQTKQEESPPAVPILTGNEFLLENRALGVNGKQRIQSITPNTITIDLNFFESVPGIPDGDVIITEIITGVRVGFAPDFDRALKIYTSQTNQKAFLFLVPNDRAANKERSSNDDFVAPIEDNNIKLLNIIEQFSTLVILPTENELSGIDAFELVYGEIFNNLLSCLYGWEQVCYVDDGISNYNTAYYAHAYDWQARKQIDYQNAYENTSTIAWRELFLGQTIFDQGDSNASTELFN